MARSTTVRHVAEGATAMTLLGASTAVSARLTRYPVFGGQMLRYVLASVVLFALLRRGERRGGLAGADVGADVEARLGAAAGIRRVRPTPTRRDLLLLVALSTSGLVLFNILVIATLRHTDSATLGSVVACSPLVLALAGPLSAGGRRRPDPATLAASAVVVAGSAMVQGFGHGTALGLGLAVGVLVCEVLFSLLAVPLLPRLGELRVSAWVTAIAVPMLLVTGLVTAGPAKLVRWPSAGEAAALLYLALPLTVGAFLLWYRALQGLGPQRAGLLIGCVPVAAGAASAVLGVGTPGLAQMAGVAVVVAGVVGGLGLGKRGRGRGGGGYGAEAEAPGVSGESAEPAGLDDPAGVAKVARVARAAKVAGVGSAEAAGAAEVAMAGEVAGATAAAPAANPAPTTRM